jgi:RNAse (barnase) inhibitor barstar
MIIGIDGAQITSWDAFHDVFARTLGFPDFYGRNMDAWIDCMTDVDADSGMSTVQVARGHVLTIAIENVDTFASRQPKIYEALLEAVALVNFRRIEVGDSAVLALSFHRRKTSR